jgi:hypothetical protein
MIILISIMVMLAVLAAAPCAARIIIYGRQAHRGLESNVEGAAPFAPTPHMRGIAICRPRDSPSNAQERGQCANATLHDALLMLGNVLPGIQRNAWRQRACAPSVQRDAQICSAEL